MNNDHQHLEKEWNRQCEKWCRDKDFVTSQFTDLVSRYSAKSRHYHSLKHIRSMLTLAKSHRAAIQNWDSVYFAIWFHDAIQGLWVDGESASAELCEAFLVRLNVPVNLVALTKDMILATKHHVAQHNSDILFTFVMEGRMVLEGDGREPFALEAGDAFVIPPGMSVRYADPSEDLELLEVSLPGVFETTERPDQT